MNKIDFQHKIAQLMIEYQEIVLDLVATNSKMIVLLDSTIEEN